MKTVVEAPLAMVPRSKDNAFPLPRFGSEVPMMVAPPTIESLSTTLVASAGPLLVTVTW